MGVIYNFLNEILNCMCNINFDTIFCCHSICFVTSGNWRYLLFFFIIQDKSELYMIELGLSQTEEISVNCTIECKAYYLEFLGFNIHLLLYEGNN